jgi:DNA anti-recombination protein RmuC
MEQPLMVPGQQVAGFTPTQMAAMQQAYGGIGAYQPFLDAAQASQAAALGATGQGIQSLGQMNFDPSRAEAFMDPYQQAVTNEALKEIDRQSQMASNQLAGKAVQAGAFGGSRFGLQQSELARNAQDLKSRRIFEDLSRNYQQAQSAAQAANQQRLQQGSAFGQLGQMTSGIGGAMAGLGAQTQALGQQDVSQLMGIGGMQQQLAQTGLNTAYQNQLAQQNAPFQQLSSAAGILQQLSPQVMGQQTTAPLPQTNPFAQAAGMLGTAGVGLANLMK